MIDSLRQLGECLDHLAHPTDDGRFSWSRLAGRVFRTPRQPKIETEVLTRLLDRIEYGYSASLRPTYRDRAQRRAEAEVLRAQAENIEPLTTAR